MARAGIEPATPRFSASSGAFGRLRLFGFYLLINGFQYFGDPRFSAVFGHRVDLVLTRAGSRSRVRSYSAPHEAHRLAGVALALLAGCGNAASDTGDNTNRRAEVLSELGIYQDAFPGAEDAAAACDRLTGEAKRNIVSELAAVAKDGLSCESVLEGAMGLFGPDDYAEVEKAREELGPADVSSKAPTKL